MTRWDLVSWNTMITRYAQSGQLDDALVLFEGLPQRGLVFWNIMTSRYTQNRCFEETLILFKGNEESQYEAKLGNLCKRPSSMCKTWKFETRQLHQLQNIVVDRCLITSLETLPKEFCNLQSLRTSYKQELQQDILIVRLKDTATTLK